MKVRYKGQSFYQGAGLTDGAMYEVVAVEPPFLRIIDDEGEDYLYSIFGPGPLDDEPGGIWEIVEDDEKGTLAKLMK